MATIFRIMICWPRCYFTFSHVDLATVRLIQVFAYIDFGGAFVHNFVHGPGFLATFCCSFGHSIWSHFVFYGHDIRPHCFWPPYKAALCLMATVIGHIVFLWPRHLATCCFYGQGIWPHFVLWSGYLATCCYGHGSWPHFVCFATVFGHILFHVQSIGHICFYGHSIWLQFVIWPQHLATLFWPPYLTAFCFYGHSI